MASEVTSGSLARGLQEGLAGVFGRTYKLHDKLYPNMFETRKSKKQFEILQMADGFAQAEDKPEGTAFTYDSYSTGFAPKAVHTPVGKAYIITHEAEEDVLYPELKRNSEEMAHSMIDLKETKAANIYNRAFSSSYLQDGGDGQPLLSTAHPRGPNDSTTYSNKLSVATAFSQVALEELSIDIAQLENPRGLKIKAKATHLIIPPALMYKAKRILGSELQSDTANNAVNALMALGTFNVEVHVNPYLTSETAYFIRTDIRDGLIYWEREPIQYFMDNDFETRNKRHAAYERYSFMWGDPRSLFGSEGA